MHKPSLIAIAAGVALMATALAGSRTRQSTPPPPVATTSSFLVSDVRVFDVERIIPKTSVLVRDGRIVSIGPALKTPAGADVIPGAGRTLMPGLIDAHAHAFDNAPERALVFGVTTELDMFTDHAFAARMRTEQRAQAGAPRCADLLSAGTLVTAPGGHGTEYGMKIPTIAAVADAQAFVDARIAEGSDYIKIVYDDGASYGMRTPSIGRDVLRAVIAATRHRGKLAVVHIGSRRGAEDAIDAGANGLVHSFADEPRDPGFAARVKAAGAFVVPTLSVTESTTAVPSGASLTKDPALLPFLTRAERLALNASFPSTMASKQRLGFAMEATRALRDAGVPLRTALRVVLERRWLGSEGSALFGRVTTGSIPLRDRRRSVAVTSR